MRFRDLPSTVARAAARRPWRAAAAALAWGTMFAAIAIVVGPFFADLTTYGFHDWDVQTSHRHLATQSLLEHGELPFWNPFACGGFPAWGYVEGATVVVSPWLPAYLALPMSVALRVEVLGYALLGAAGAYLLAASFTRSHAARALVAALWAVDGRWGLQTAAGHTWHLAYAYLPWALLLFERARTGPPRTPALLAAAAPLAMLVYAGGIYPLPHTVLGLGLYAAALAVFERSPRPLVRLGLVGVVAFGLAAPKLLPMLDVFGKAPRLVDSVEKFDLGGLVTALTSPDQGFSARPAPLRPYGWHEWGIYVSAPGALLLATGLLTVGGRRETALKLAGAALLVLGLGAFHPRAPWTLLHDHVPFFRSQHVPSRFLYPAVLLLAVVVAAGVGRLVDRRAHTRPWLDVALGLLVLALAVDVARVARKPMTSAMWMVPPPIPEPGPFRFSQQPPLQYLRADWAGPMYLAMLANTGVIECYGTPPFARRGARAVTDPRYRGEAFVVGGGEARVVGSRPNGATLEVEGASPGALVVYNMNYDEGWRASTGPVVPFEDTVATPVPAGASRVELRYVPPRFELGLLAAALTLGAVALAWRRERRLERGGS